MNLKFKAPKLETIKRDVEYAITINPEIQPKTIDTKELTIWHRKMWDNYREKEVQLELYPETSPTGRMHYHGFIKVSNYMAYVDFVKMLSHTSAGEIDTIADQKVFKEYCIKQSHIWKPIFEKTVIGYPMKVSSEASLIKGVKKVKEKGG